MQCNGGTAMACRTGGRKVMVAGVSYVYDRHEQRDICKENGSAYDE